MTIDLPAARAAMTLRRSFGGSWAMVRGELVGDLGAIRVTLTPPKPDEPADLDSVPTGYCPMPPISDLHWQAVVSTLGKERKADDVTAPAAVRSALLLLRESMASAAEQARRDVAVIRAHQRRHEEAAERLAAILGGGG